MNKKELEHEVVHRFLPSIPCGTRVAVGIGGPSEQIWYSGLTLKSKVVDQIARDMFYWLTFENPDGTEFRITLQLPADKLVLDNECPSA